MGLNYSQSWDYYLIPVQCVSCQVCARPSETNLAFARGTQQLYFKPKFQKKKKKLLSDGSKLYFKQPLKSSLLPGQTSAD